MFVVRIHAFFAFVVGVLGIVTFVVGSLVCCGFVPNLYVVDVLFALVLFVMDEHLLFSAAMGSFVVAIGVHFVATIVAPFVSTPIVEIVGIFVVSLSSIIFVIGVLFVVGVFPTFVSIVTRFYCFCCWSFVNGCSFEFMLLILVLLAFQGGNLVLFLFPNS